MKTQRCKYYLIGGNNEILSASDNNELKNKCNYNNDDILLKREMQDSLFDMNNTLIMAFNKYPDLLVDYKIPSKELLDKFKNINEGVETYMEVRKCKHTHDNINEKNLLYIAHEINIRRFIQIYINKLYNINITRGFLKMYDILNKFELIDLTKDNINSFHSCECPGNFINATNYWIKKHKPNLVFNWTGNSLNPFNPATLQEYGNVLSDEYGYLKKYPDRWDYGRDMIGDITNPENLMFWKSKYNYSIDLFTSDCGYCETFNKFDNDKMLIHLSLCQLLLGLLLLKLGGNIVCKIFLPINYPMTISILYLYTMYFENVNIIKQTSGSLSSSEIYVVGKNKTKHLDEFTEKKLIDIINVKIFDINNVLFDMFPNDFINDITEISNTYIEKIKIYIESLLYYIDNPTIFDDHKKNYMKLAKKICAKKWIKENDFQLIDKKYML